VGYLFAEDLERRQLRTFALPRMRKVKLTTEASAAGRIFRLRRS